MEERRALEAKVVEILADALDRRPDEIRLHSSLVDDLGAESIDFLDIVFRLESAFDVRIPEDEIWRGSVGLDPADPEALEAGLAGLRERMPDFRWDRFPARPGRHDLPRLITPETIVDYLSRLLARPAGTAAPSPSAPDAG